MALAGEKDLWIVVHHANGLTSFHPVDPSAQGKYGETQPRDLAIDGTIEGQYLDSDDTSDFKNEHYRGWVPWR